jgi:EAL domain-containing protein (putative c-di-GMP-specific phosphodiesterase class I)
MNVANSRKLHIQSLLKGAIKRNNFELHFQPINDAKHGHVVAAEALLRWVDPEIGPVGPEEFIPIAEQCGLVSGIGEWVMRTACRQLRAWQDAGYEEIRIAVNVSAKQLCDLDWVDSIAETLRETGVSPGCLELELTETTIINDDSTTIETLSSLSDMGVGIVLDDFGTGYSSLSHLRGLPINRVKIDRSFVSDVCEDKQSAALAGAIVVLAHSLQIKVVAEGVETHEQANFLREVGCDELQGYLMSRAVSASDFERFLTRAKPE